MDLTRRQTEIFNYICSYIDSHNYAPSVRDIAAHFALSSAGGVHKHLKNLKDKRYITFEQNISRSIQILKKEFSPINRLNTESSILSRENGFISLPLKGKVAAGIPIQYSLDNESMTFPDYMVKNPEKSYVLQVQGDSMIEECICDGDFVLVEHREFADNGEMVIAMINYAEATLKKFYKEKDRIRLQPANHTMDPIYVSPKELSIQGIVVGIWRKYF